MGSLRFFTIALSIFLILALPQVVQAERLNSESYIIQFGNFNTGAGTQNSTSYNVTNTIGQTAAGPFGTYGSTNYFIGSGFQYIYHIKEFSFSLSDITMDLGVLTIGSFNTDSHDITINTRGGGGYQVFAYELEPLGNSSGSIPQATCDDGLCTFTTATPWTNAANPGFGYNISGSGAVSEFVDATYFKPFADASNSEQMQAVMSSSNLAIDETATVTYKASPPSSGVQGQLSTSVVYVAVPGY